MILNNVTIGSGENLDPELSTQDDLIAQIAAALEGKTGAGSVSVDTCTVNINDSSGFIICVAATTFENNTINKFLSSEDDPMEGFSLSGGIINNVVKNSIICVCLNNPYYTIEQMSGAIELYSRIGNEYEPITVFVFQVVDENVVIDLVSSW